MSASVGAKEASNFFVLFVLPSMESTNSALAAKIEATLSVVLLEYMLSAS